MENQKLGKPVVVVSWPDGVEFNARAISESSGLSLITVYKKINEALDNHVIEAVRKTSGCKGRPQTFYKKCVTNSVVAVPA